MQRVDSLEKTLMLGGTGGRRRRGQQRIKWLDGWMASLTRWTWVWENSGSWWWTGKPGMLRFMGSQRVGHTWVTELNWWYSNSRVIKNHRYQWWIVLSWEINKQHEEINCPKQAAKFIYYRRYFNKICVLRFSRRLEQGENKQEFFFFQDFVSKYLSALGQFT